MKIISTLITAFLSLSLLHSQQTSLEVSESEEYKDKVKATGVLAIHTNEVGLTGVVRESKRDILFDVFDTALEKTHSLVI